jgi:integrase/recombinase XerD
MGEVIEGWGNWLEKQVSANTVERYATSMGMLSPFLEGRFLDEIDSAMIADIVRRRQASGVTNATIKRDLSALSSVLTFAKTQGWQTHNPVKDHLGLIRERRDPIVLPRPEDVERAIKRAPGLLSMMAQAAVATGCRQEELAGARHSQLNLETKRLTVIGKRNKLRVIDLEPFGGVEVFAALPPGEPNHLYSGTAITSAIGELTDGSAS